jgi:hypothetical protein
LVQKLGQNLLSFYKTFAIIIYGSPIGARILIYLLKGEIKW